jgi:hypothetical protein
MTSPVFKQLYESTLSDALHEDALLLDIGAKDGKIASELADSIGCRALALDIDFDDEAATLPCDAVQADGAAMPFPDGSVDAIISNMVFDTSLTRSDSLPRRLVSSLATGYSSLSVRTVPGRATATAIQSGCPGCPMQSETGSQSHTTDSTTETLSGIRQPTTPCGR